MAALFFWILIAAQRGDEPSPPPLSSRANPGSPARAGFIGVPSRRRFCVCWGDWPSLGWRSEGSASPTVCHPERGLYSSRLSSRASGASRGTPIGAQIYTWNRGPFDKLRAGSSTRGKTGRSPRVTGIVLVGLCRAVGFGTLGDPCHNPSASAAEDDSPPFHVLG